MKKSILAAVALLSTSSAFAGYGSGTVSTYTIDTVGWVTFGTAVPLANTCSYFGEQFRFDSTTTVGKNLLQTVLAAKATGLTLRVWYNDSTTPGQTEAGSCTYTTMAVLTNIGLQ